MSGMVWVVHGLHENNKNFEQGCMSLWSTRDLALKEMKLMKQMIYDRNNWNFVEERVEPEDGLLWVFEKDGNYAHLSIELWAILG